MCSLLLLRAQFSKESVCVLVIYSSSGFSWVIHLMIHAYAVALHDS